MSEVADYDQARIDRVPGVGWATANEKRSTASSP
jgi:hypothetical protein